MWNSNVVRSTQKGGSRERTQAKERKLSQNAYKMDIACGEAQRFSKTNM